MAWTYANSGATTAWAAAAASFQVGSGGGGGSAWLIATPRKIFLKPKTPWPPRRLSLSWPLRWIAKPSKTLQRKPSAPIAACLPTLTIKHVKRSERHLDVGATMNGNHPATPKALTRSWQLDDQLAWIHNRGA